MTAELDLAADLTALTRAVVDVPSVSGDESGLADLVEAALRRHRHLEVLRDGDTVVARTHAGRARRVVVAGHLDTVPVAGNLPSRSPAKPGAHETRTGAAEVRPRQRRHGVDGTESRVIPFRDGGAEVVPC